MAPEPKHDRTCPQCGEQYVSAIEVAVVGTGGPRVDGGRVCVETTKDSQNWRLYVHDE